MNKKETIKALNIKIDQLILDGKRNTPEFNRLCKLHYKITHNK